MGDWRALQEVWRHCGTLLKVMPLLGARGFAIGWEGHCGRLGGTVGALGALWEMRVLGG